jgi:hypothetical protein
MIQKPEAMSVTAEAIGSEEAIGYILKRKSLAKIWGTQRSMNRQNHAGGC